MFFWMLMVSTSLEAPTYGDWTCSWWDHRVSPWVFFPRAGQSVLLGGGSGCKHAWCPWDAGWMHERADQCLQRSCPPKMPTHSSHMRMASVRVCSSSLHCLPLSFTWPSAAGSPCISLGPLNVSSFEWNCIESAYSPTIDMRIPSGHQ